LTNDNGARKMFKIIVLSYVSEMTGQIRILIYQLCKDGHFPRQVDFSDIGIKAARWNSDQVQAWIDARTQPWSHSATGSGEGGAKV
jgi:predicted DNA-binding transcriptional regulator AlpA